MPDSRGSPTRLASLVGKGRTVERTRPAREGGARDAKLVRIRRCGLCDDEASRMRPAPSPRDGAAFFYTGYTAVYASHVFWEPGRKAALHKGFLHFPQGYPHMFM